MKAAYKGELIEEYHSCLIQEMHKWRDENVFQNTMMMTVDDYLGIVHRAKIKAKEKSDESTRK